MLTTFILYILSFILSLVAGFSNIIAKDVSIWPPIVLQGLTYFFTSLMKIDFVLNIVQLLTSMKWLVGFLIVYVLIKLFLKLINWLRGSGELDV